MKRKLGLITFSVIITTLSSVMGFAQSKEGINLYILKAEGNIFVPADPGKPMLAGDKIKISFEALSNGYVYVVNVKPNGNNVVVFPNAQEPDNQIRVAQRFDLPRMSGFVLGKQEGVEVFQLFQAKERIPFFDDAIKEHSGDLGNASAASAAAELVVPGIKSRGESTYLGSSGLAEQLQSIKSSLNQISTDADARMKNIEARLDQLSEKVDRLIAKLEASRDDKQTPRSGSSPASRSKNKVQPGVPKNITSAPGYVDPNSGGRVILTKEEKKGTFVSIQATDTRLKGVEIYSFEIRLRVLTSSSPVRPR